MSSRILSLVVGIIFTACVSTPKYSAHFDEPRDPIVVAQSSSGSYKYNNVVDVGDVDADNMTAALLKIVALAESGAKELTLRIDSFGGSIFLGNLWIKSVEDIKKSSGLTVTCIVDGSAYSMGAVILESPVCDKRLATKRSTILFHNGSSSSKGTAEDLKQSAEFLEALNVAMGLMVSERMGIAYEDYRARIHNRDWTMAVIEALEQHAIDGLVHPNDIAPPA